ncbi:MAG: V-type ATPase subunit [Candidatus Verstraetearchaeota archaeon]|nr:V-type ATPase subunit [Candidatus Verstraetearchaeota archaeon]
MTDTTYTIVKAAARKGRILTADQFSELASAKDLKELANRLRERVPGIDAATATIKDFEGAVYKNFLEEVDDFIKASPKFAGLFSLFKREVTDLEKADLVKAILAKSTGEQPPGGAKSEELAKLSAEGYEEEVEEAAKMYEEYKLLGLVDVVFERQRLLRLWKEAKKAGREARGGIRDFLVAKVDFFNVITILRGIKNGIPAVALERMLIYRLGSIPDEELKGALRQGELEKVIKALSEAGVLGGASPRELEKGYESILGKISERAYYRNYTNLGAVMAYLELKLREARNLVRIANILDRSLEAKKVLQEFVY